MKIENTDIGDGTGCGKGTEHACFGLTLGSSGRFECAVAVRPDIALCAAAVLGGRLNVDEKGQVVCPLGLENNAQIIASVSLNSETERFFCL